MYIHQIQIEKGDLTGWQATTNLRDEHLRTRLYIDTVCLFGDFRPTGEFFTHMEMSPLPVKGFKFFTFTQHPWPLSCKGSLAGHTYCDMGHPFIVVNS